MGDPDVELAVVFVSDNGIRKLNRQFRDIDSPTDVLSFPAYDEQDPYPEKGPLGDIIISVETADRQAKELGHSLDDELTRLLVHGILHLSGYDHKEAAERKKMRAKESGIIKRLARG